jgi:quinol monooxygenase YgiN
MLTVIARYRTSPAAAETVAEVLRRHAEDSEREPGCRQFHVFHDREDQTWFFLVETYDSEAAFTEHRQTAHFRRNIEAELAPLLLEREWHRCEGPLLPAECRTQEVPCPRATGSASTASSPTRRG